MLYIFRSIAGIGGGGMTNLAMVIVSDVVSLEQRGNPAFTGAKTPWCVRLTKQPVSIRR